MSLESESQKNDLRTVMGLPWDAAGDAMWMVYGWHMEGLWKV